MLKFLNLIKLYELFKIKIKTKRKINILSSKEKFESNPMLPRHNFPVDSFTVFHISNAAIFFFSISKLSSKILSSYKFMYSLLGSFSLISSFVFWILFMTSFELGISEAGNVKSFSRSKDKSEID